MIDQLLAPVSSDTPSGVCLEYDRRFQSLVSASHGRSEQQLGSNIVPASDPDWHFLATESSALLTESRDVRLLVIWAYANLRLSGLEGLARGIEAIAALVEARWDSVHPHIEPDGDWYIRVNAVAGLADPDSVLQVLRDLLLGSIQGAPITVRDVCMLADGTQPVGCPTPNFEQLRIAFQDCVPDCQTQFGICLRIIDGLASIKRAFVSRLSHDAQPNLDPLEHIIESLRRLYVPAEASQQQPVQTNGVDTASAASGQSAQALQSRSDALRALAVAREYFERHEPSNPASLLIKRAERLASLTFLEIIEDMAPASMDHVRMQAGLNR
jgi:type VI secretion system protein ImpA